MGQLPRPSPPCVFLLCPYLITLVPHPCLFLRQPINFFSHHRLQFLLTPPQPQTSHLLPLVYFLLSLLLPFLPLHPLLFLLPTSHPLLCLINL